MKSLAVTVCFLALLTLPSPAKAAGNVRVFSSIGYLDPSGNYRIIGEVKNIGDHPVNFIQVTATYYDSYGSVLDTRFDLTMLNVMLEGRKSPFEIALLDVAESSLVNNYTLGVTFLEVEPIPERLSIVSNITSKDAENRLHIVGELKNEGDSTLTNARVVATCYNAFSNIVAVGQTGFDPEEGPIGPNQTASFEILISEDRAQYVSTYVLSPESNEYAAIPEFAEYSLILPFVILTISLLLARSISRKTGRQSRCKALLALVA